MSLRTRLVVGLAVVALVLGGAAVAITRAAEGYLVGQVDDRLPVLDGGADGFADRWTGGSSPGDPGGADDRAPARIPGPGDPRSARTTSASSRTTRS